MNATNDLELAYENERRFNLRRPDVKAYTGDLLADTTEAAAERQRLLALGCHPDYFYADGADAGL